MKNNIENVTNNAESNVEQSKDKAYEKVTHYVKERIKTGELRVGDKIPTERELSEKLELSRNSVREALRTMYKMPSGFRKLYIRGNAADYRGNALHDVYA